MIRLLNSGKFWLKLVCYSLLVLLLLVVGLSALTYRLFSPERVSRFAGAIVDGSGLSIRYDKDISRNWFPRPTLTLRNIVITQPNSPQAALLIRKTQIGLAWKSLWTGKPMIEKWVVKGADALLEHSDKGWSLRDLWRQNSGESAVNRLVVENSTLRLRSAQGSYTIEAFGLNIKAPVADGRPFQISGAFSHAAIPLTWQGKGTFQTDGTHWRIPAFRLEAQGRLNRQTLTVRADSILDWQPQHARLSARNTELRADSSYRSLHLTAQIPQFVFQNNRLDIPALNSAFTAGEDGQNWDGAVKIDKASLRSRVATIGSFEFNASHKNADRQTSLTASGPLIWQHNEGLQSEPLRLSALQEAPGRAPQPRFATSLQGKFALRDSGHWQGSFNGFFDKQPTAIVLRYTAEPKQKAKLEAGIALQKLSLVPYWEDLQAQSGHIYPDFLNREDLPDIAAQIEIGSIQMPGLQLDDVAALLHADRRYVALSNFRAGLYGGRTEGGMVMANTEPLSYRLQQNTIGVSIRPLLQDLFGYHSLSGRGDAVIDLSAKGNDRQSLTRTLGGTLSLNVSDGMWYGIDIDNILRSGRTDKQNGQHLQTPFRRFTLHSTISEGVSRHSNTELLSDSLRVISSGYTDLNKQELSEALLIHNARNPQIKPIPLKISGAVLNPSVTIDYQRLTDGLNTPQEKQKALENTLREQWQWLLPKRN
ncbi:uncharacterized protein involved in outer membrane biogenesis [Neisseria perflava]|uniref:AsmA family protein n=1 Tax=Neisseria perflava TaxID=33053 RepID=UPI0020A153FF|nr:AsmA family protein [Neisseria perflava]MCP1772347.1 uncharacterized protein involved in outer membrane biogenesis [Neisseria perflava]